MKNIDLGFDILDYDPRNLPESLEDADYLWPGSIDEPEIDPGRYEVDNEYGA